MTTNQQGDIVIYQTDDGGEIDAVGGVLRMGGGLDTAVYLSLFGGNQDDAGEGVASPLEWWGNQLETDPARKYRSRTQTILRGLPAVSGNLRRVESSALRDLHWFTRERVASSVTVAASIPGLNKIRLDVIIEANGKEEEFSFTENWKAGE